MYDSSAQNSNIMIWEECQWTSSPASLQLCPRTYPKLSVIIWSNANSAHHQVRQGCKVSPSCCDWSPHPHENVLIYPVILQTVLERRSWCLGSLFTEYMGLGDWQQWNKHFNILVILICSNLKPNFGLLSHFTHHTPLTLVIYFSVSSIQQMSC